MTLLHYLRLHLYLKFTFKYNFILKNTVHCTGLILVIDINSRTYALQLELFKSEPTRKPESKPKVDRCKNVFVFLVYRTDSTRTEVAPELVDNWKLESWTRAVTDFYNRHITVSRDYLNLIMSDPSLIRPESCSKPNLIRLKPTYLERIFDRTAVNLNQFLT